MKRITCKHCNYFLGNIEVMVGELLCPNSACKATSQFKIVEADMSKLYGYKFITEEVQPKRKGTK